MPESSCLTSDIPIIRVAKATTPTITRTTPTTEAVRTPEETPAAVMVGVETKMRLIEVVLYPSAIAVLIILTAVERGWHFPF